MKRYSKFIVALLAAAAALVSSGVLPDHVAVWVNAGIAVVSAALVVLVPNAQLPNRPTGGSRADR